VRLDSPCNEAAGNGMNPEDGEWVMVTAACERSEPGGIDWHQLRHR